MTFSSDDINTIDDAILEIGAAIERSEYVSEVDELTSLRDRMYQLKYKIDCEINNI